MDKFGAIVRSLAEWLSLRPKLPIVFGEAEINLPIRTRRRPFLEVLFVTEGSLRLSVGTRSADLTAGDIALINAHFGNYDTPTGNGSHYSCVSFDVSHCPTLRRLRSAPLLEICSVADRETIRQLYREASELYHARSGQLPELQLKVALLRLLVAVMAEGETAAIPGGLVAGGNLREALALMWREHANPDLRLADLARSAHLSKDHFGRRFRREFGLSPMRYLLQLRLRRARNLLLKSGLGVKQIALIVGFRDPLYFSRAYRRLMRQTPTAARAARVLNAKRKNY